ncbi:hypothetical protein BD560DRAFT_162207 [Blakeslea trispora]|nr:hypothetical protein BD560DRAFT_162207 [Blakeslea trispora]
MSKHFRQSNSHAPPVPQSNTMHPQQIQPYPTSSPYPPTTGPVRPIESQSTPAFHGNNPYPAQQQQRPAYVNPQPYPPTNPTPSVSAGTQQLYPQQQQQAYSSPLNSGHPSSYAGPSPVQSNRPTSPPPHVGHGYPESTPASSHAPLLSSSYNPQQNANGHRLSYGGYPSHNGGYAHHNNVPGNRNSFPIYNNSSPYPPSQQYGGFPEPQQFTGGYTPHADTLGTPFAAHQGGYLPNPSSSGYPPSNSPYPPYQQGHPPSGYPPY